MSKITIGITELRENLGRDDGIEEPNKSGTVIFRQRLCYRALDSETTTTQY